MKDDTMNTDASMKMKERQITGKVGNDGKSFVSDNDNKNWTIVNHDDVKGHEEHHVTLTTSIDEDKSEIRVKSLKMAK